MPVTSQQPRKGAVEDLKKQLTLAALRCLLQERVTGGKSASTFDLLCLLSSSMVIFVGVRKLLLVHTSSLTVVAAVVWHWKGCRDTCVSSLADFSISHP